MRRRPRGTGEIMAEERREVYPRRPAGLLFVRGQRATTVVVKPPRGVNSPVTRNQAGLVAATKSRNMRLTAFS